MGNDDGCATARCRIIAPVVRLVSYNILDGGERGADQLATVIAARRPDVICLAEASREAVVRQIADHLQMDSIIGPGGRQPVALLCRWPIAWSIDHATLAGSEGWSFLRAAVQMPGGIELPIGVVHLTPRAGEADETLREGQVLHLLDACAEDRRLGRAHLLAGDFNANSPGQQIDPEKCKESTKRAFYANGGQIPRRAIAMLLAAGYVDTLAAHDPAGARSAVSFTTEKPGQRVDYIFTWGPNLKVRDAWIDNSPAAVKASDHFPIGVDVTLNHL
jgi:endonuclease/exonuclease/phosphatase family metal-dependent hydrolase